MRSSGQGAAGRLRVLPIVVAMSLGWAVPALADFLVERGDVLSVTVFEDATLSREAKVNLDGRIMLPQLGAIDVAGQDLSAIRQSIEAELSRRDIVLKPTVLIDVVQYRPFYVGGAVERPGAIAFEPGLTVRHAILLAGGPVRIDEAEAPTAAEVRELRSRLRAAVDDLRQTESLIARLKGELNRDPDFKTDESGDAAEVSRDTAVIRELDLNLLENRIEEWTGSQQQLAEEVELITQELDILQRQAALQKEDFEIQQDLVESTRALYEKGLVPLPRLQELQREAARLSRDLLETESFAARALQNRSRAEHALQSSETDWRITVQSALRNAELDRSELENAIGLLRDQLLAVGLEIDADGGTARMTETVTIHRQTGTGTATFAADLDTEINPGDLLEVSIASQTGG